ncbi:MAG: glycosyltransferase family 4 protein [Acidimicrobiales bacterium]|jgi:glycosyltransferase involved in cell wall biosynthesis|nr:glycosyltransferase family 4 protein [Acidimicrobiales bacterium]
MGDDRITGDRPGGDLGSLVDGSDIRRVHVLAWRDVDDAEAGGSELHLREVTRRWVAAGLEVCVRTSEVPGEPTTVVRDGVKVVRRSGRYKVFPQAILAEILGRHGRRDALVEVWNGVPFLTPLWARGPRMAIQHHDHADMWPLVLSPGLARLGSLLERRLAPPCYRSTPVVTLSTSSRVGLIDGLGHQPDGVHVVEPGIHHRFSPAGRRDAQPLVVSVGRLTASKRVDVLIRAFAEARDQVADLRLEVIGDGPEESSLRSLAADRGVADAVAFRGRISDDDLVDAYRRARLVASASISEGWGMTLTEGAACGTPTVATDIAGHRDAVDNGRSGLLAAEDSALPGLIVEAIGSRWDQLSAGALTFATRFDWDRTATEAFRILDGTVSSQ